MLPPESGPIMVRFVLLPPAPRYMDRFEIFDKLIEPRP